MNTLRDHLAGMTPPLVTPFADGALDLTAFETLVDHAVAGGVDALFVCGTTGEATSLSHSEQVNLLTHAVDYAPADVPVLTGGTGTSIADTMEWIEQATSWGADGVFLTPPFFHTANEPAGYRDFFEPIVTESSLPLVLYNIPGYVGAKIPTDLVRDLAERESVIGLKDSSGDLGYGMTIVEETPDDFLVLQGFDELLLPSMRMGFDGGVNAGANVLPDTYATVVTDPYGDDALERHNESIRPLFALCEEHGFAPGIKAALARRDILPNAAVRPPHVDVDPATLSN